MANHAVIITDLNGTHNDTAQIDFCNVKPGESVDFNVRGFANGAFSLPTNNDDFVTTPDLFAITNFATALVTASGFTDPTFAVLRQKKLIMQVPPVTKTSGIEFDFPVGDTGTGAFLLLGNLNGAQANGVLTIGQGGAPVANVAVPPAGVQTIPINAAWATKRLTVTITNGLEIIVQVLVNGHGQEFVMTLLTPTVQL